jgi:hypothetical protein
MSNAATSDTDGTRSEHTDPSTATSAPREVLADGPGRAEP